MEKNISKNMENPPSKRNEKIFSERTSLNPESYKLEGIQIHGFNKLTLLDYPGHTGAVLFLGHCNFRCPFCQNSPLVLTPDKEPLVSLDEIFSFLKKRQGILEGVCISGGEPTLSPRLPELAALLKELGYLVKLDTNGSRPDVIKSLVDRHLVDYIAMDIKSSRERYPDVCGCSIPLSAIEESVQFLLSGETEYEFRTTVVRELHRAEDFISISRWISGSRQYFLQSYKDSDGVMTPGFHSCTDEELHHYLSIVQQTIPSAKLRGVE